MTLTARAAALSSAAANRSGSHARAGLWPQQIVPRGDTWPYGWPQPKTPPTTAAALESALVDSSVEFSRPLALDGVPPAGTSLRWRRRPRSARRLPPGSSSCGSIAWRARSASQPVDAGRTFLVTRPRPSRCRADLRGDPRAGAGAGRGEFDRLFSREVPVEAEGEVEIDPEAEVPEPLADDQLDLGEVLAEELSLALDPYPRSPDGRPLSGRDSRPHQPGRSWRAVRRA